MKIFDWMQCKFNGKRGREKPNSKFVNKNTLPGPSKEELIDWPNCLLAIGTLGNENLKEDIERSHNQDNNNAATLSQDLTSEERSTTSACLDQNKNNGIGKKSFSFLLKKMFVCRNGFELPHPKLRDPIQESRLEKILRALLHKKIYPQSSTPSSPGKKYLEKRHMSKFNDEDEEAFEKTEVGSKWVKTDSEYIVLEI